MKLQAGDIITELLKNLIIIFVSITLLLDTLCGGGLRTSNSFCIQCVQFIGYLELPQRLSYH